MTHLHAKINYDGTIDDGDGADGDDGTEVVDNYDFFRALCPEGVFLRGLDSLASASIVVVAVPR